MVLVCIVPECRGHDDKLDAILHSLHHIAAGQRTNKTETEHIMGIAQDILAAENAEAAAVSALGGAVTTAVTKLADVEKQLADLIANGTLSDDDKAALQTALDTATASKTELDASLAEVDGALNPAPADGGTGDGGTPPTDGTDASA